MRRTCAAWTTVYVPLKSPRAAVALALHDLNVVARWADAVAVLHAGRLHVAGPPAAVLDDELVASVFGVRVERLTAADGRPTLVFHRRPRQPAPDHVPRRAPARPGVRSAP